MVQISPRLIRARSRWAWQKAYARSDLVRRAGGRSRVPGRDPLSLSLLGAVHVLVGAGDQLVGTEVAPGEHGADARTDRHLFPAEVERCRERLLHVTGQPDG